MNKQKICIIGGSLTGLVTAISLSKLNCEIDLVMDNNKKITKSNPFKPDNDLKKNIWFSLNIDELRSYTGLEVSEYVIYVQNMC